MRKFYLLNCWGLVALLTDISYIHWSFSYSIVVLYLSIEICVGRCHFSPLMSIDICFHILWVVVVGVSGSLLFEAFAFSWCGIRLLAFHRWLELAWFVILRYRRWYLSSFLYSAIVNLKCQVSSFDSWASYSSNSVNSILPFELIFYHDRIFLGRIGLCAWIGHQNRGSWSEHQKCMLWVCHFHFQFSYRICQP